MIRRATTLSFEHRPESSVVLALNIREPLTALHLPFGLDYFANEGQQVPLVSHQ
jgi:hypothetical protein